MYIYIHMFKTRQGTHDSEKPLVSSIPIKRGGTAHFGAEIVMGLLDNISFSSPCLGPQ